MTRTAAIFVLIALVASISACGGPPPVPVGAGGPQIVDGGALFRYRNPGAKTVHLVGDFNAWTPTSDPMVDENGDGEWTLFYPLSPGRYAYKFIVDGKKWISDPSNPLTEPDGFDGQNSIVVVPATGDLSK